MNEQNDNKMLVKITKSKDYSKRDTGEILDTFILSDDTGMYDVGNQRKSVIMQLIKEPVKRPNYESSDSDSSLGLDKLQDKSSQAPETGKPNTKIQKYPHDSKGKISKIHMSVTDATKTDEEITKSEMVLSILDELIITRVLTFLEDDKPTWKKIQSPSESLLHTTSSRMKDRVHKSKQTGLPTVLDQTTKYSDKGKRPRIGSVVKMLGLPIKPCEPKPFQDPRVDLGGIQMPLPTVLSATSDVSARRKPEKEVTTFKWDTQSDSAGSEKQPNSPFELRWCFGYNPEVPIINLSTDDTYMILFASSNIVVLHNFHENTMNFMEGHQNIVSCLAIDPLGLHMVSADCGKNNRVIIWNSNTWCVEKILEDVHPLGTKLVGLSSDGEYLVTVSPLPQQVIQMWLWQTDNIEPAVERYSNEWCGEIKKLTMNPYSADEFALTYESGVTFVYIEKVKDKYGFHFDPHLFPPKLGTFTDTTFLSEQRPAALSSTSLGFVVVWITDTSSQRKKIHEKHISLHLGSITHIEAVDNMVAIAMGSGNVSFYDPNLKGLFFSRKMKLGELISLSFNKSSQRTHIGSSVFMCSSHESCAVTWRRQTTMLVDATLNNNDLFVRPFIVSTKSGKIVFFNTPNDPPKYILYPSNAIYTAIDIFPNSHFLCAGTAAGQILLFDTKDLKVKALHQLKASGDDVCQAVGCLRYSPSGSHLACGMYTGEVWLLDPLLLKPKPNMPLTDCSAFITHMVFSPEEDFLAVADSSFCVTLFTIEQRLKMVGQFYAHTKPVRGLLFNSTRPELRIFSLGEDRYLVEFEISYVDGEAVLNFKKVYRVEQTAVPLCMTPHPSSAHYIMANSEMKFKLVQYENLKCCKTVRAPDLGMPITFLKPLPGNDSKYLVFRTLYHLGLQMLPLDGNPYRAMAIKASPNAIISCKVHSNGKYIFTISENSSSIKMWKINTLAVDEFFDNGEQGLDAYLSLLEGGKGGRRDQDLREFFLTGQFIHQGERPSIARSLSGSLPVSMIANVFQAMGFFPTKYQVENILYEVTGKTNPARGTIKFDDFLCLYVNHRPSTELTRADLLDAFNGFYQRLYFADRDSSSFKTDPERIFDSASFVEKIMITGEETSFTEINTDLSILTEGNLDLIKDGVSPGLPMLPFMPKEFSFNTFIHEILGFPGNEDHFTSFSTSQAQRSALFHEPLY